jgi:hypothetical protein
VPAHEAQGLDVGHTGHVTLEEYQRLVAAGVIDKVEFIDGEVRMGDHRLEFAASQVKAAAQLGVDLTRERHSVTGDPA